MKIYVGAWAVFLNASLLGVQLPFAGFVFAGLIVWGVMGGLRAISGGDFYTTR